MIHQLHDLIECHGLDSGLVDCAMIYLPQVQLSHLFSVSHSGSLKQMYSNCILIGVLGGGYD